MTISDERLAEIAQGLEAMAETPGFAKGHVAIMRSAGVALHTTADTEQVGKGVKVAVEQAMQALLPCPFCGGEADGTGKVKYGHRAAKENGWGQDEFYFANCIKCGTSNVGLVGHRTPEAAIEAWNRRASTTPSGEVEGLEVAASAERVSGRYRINLTEPELRAWAQDAVKVIRVLPVRLSEASTALASMKREVERLTSMLEGMLPVSGNGDFVFIDGPGDVEIDHGGKLRSRAEAAEARIQELEKALIAVSSASHITRDRKHYRFPIQIMQRVDSVLRSASQALGRK